MPITNKSVAPKLNFTQINSGEEKHYTIVAKQTVNSDNNTMYHYEIIIPHAKKIITIVSNFYSESFFMALAEFFTTIFKYNKPLQVIETINNYTLLSEVFYSSAAKEKADEFLHENKNAIFTVDMIIEYLYYSYSIIIDKTPEDVIQNWHSIIDSNNDKSVFSKINKKFNSNKEAKNIEIFKQLCPALYDYSCYKIRFFSTFYRKFSIKNIKVLDYLYKTNVARNNDSHLINNIKMKNFDPDNYDFISMKSYFPIASRDYPITDYLGNSVSYEDAVNIINTDYDDVIDFLYTLNISNCLFVEFYAFNVMYKNHLKNDVVGFLQNIIENGRTLNIKDELEKDAISANSYNAIQSFIKDLTKDYEETQSLIDSKNKLTDVLCYQNSINNNGQRTYKTHRSNGDIVYYNLYSNVCINYLNNIKDKNYSDTDIIMEFNKIIDVIKSLYYIDYENVYLCIQKIGTDDFIDLLLNIKTVVDEAENIEINSSGFRGLQHRYGISQNTYQNVLTHTNKIIKEYLDNYEDYKDMPVSWWLELINMDDK